MAIPIGNVAQLPVDIFPDVSMPCSVASGWLTVNVSSLGTAPAGGFPTYVATAPSDASFVVGALNTFKVFGRQQGRGTTLRTRQLYDVNVSAISSPLKYILLGRKRPDAAGLTQVQADLARNTQWQILPNKAGSSVVTMVYDLVNDLHLTNSLLASTLSIADVNAHDCEGCDEFYIIYTQIFTGTSGDDTLAQFQVRII